MPSTRLEAGDSSPSFSVVSDEGATVSLSDYAGQRVILYFYPAASTPGCTTQACDFRDNLSALTSAGYVVLGISKDNIDDLKKFRAEQHLNFPLLSDQDVAVHKAYGAWGEKSLYGKIVTGTLRSTFVIDAEGKIEHALYNVKATGHLNMLRKKLGLAA